MYIFITHYHDLLTHSEQHVLLFMTEKNVYLCCFRNRLQFYVVDLKNYQNH